MFPAIRPYFSGAAAEPGKLGAPVKTFIQVTKTEGLTDRGYRAVPACDSEKHLLTKDGCFLPTPQLTQEPNAGAGRQ